MVNGGGRVSASLGCGGVSLGLCVGEDVIPRAIVKGKGKNGNVNGHVE